MTLLDAIKKLDAQFSVCCGVDPQTVATILTSAGAPDSVPTSVLDRVVKAGRALAKLGIK